MCPEGVLTTCAFWEFCADGNQEGRRVECGAVMELDLKRRRITAKCEARSHRKGELVQNVGSQTLLRF